jgi:hypothetical protein
VRDLEAGAGGTYRRLLERLTPGEHEVFGPALRGLSSKEIARLVALGPRPVEAHRPPCSRNSNGVPPQSCFRNSRWPGRHGPGMMASVRIRRDLSRTRTVPHTAPGRCRRGPINYL